MEAKRETKDKVKRHLKDQESSSDAESLSDFEEVEPTIMDDE